MTHCRYLPAELLRARHSALQWLPLAAVPLLLLTYSLATLVDPNEDASGVLMWQAMYLTGVAAPLITLFVATAENREKKANFGGTWLLTVLAGHAGGRRILQVGLFAFIGAIGVAGLAAMAARLTGLIGVTRPVVEGPTGGSGPWPGPCGWCYPRSGCIRTRIPA